MSKIMLVEDDNSLREIYGARLVAEGYEIVSAHDGEEALAVAIKERPDLILTDIMMPKISGFDMIDILRSTTETKNIKIVIMTALSRPEDQKRGENLGADKYLVKSQVTLEDVVKAIHDTLGDNTGSVNNPTSASTEEIAPQQVHQPNQASPTPQPAPPINPSQPQPAPAPQATPTDTSANVEQPQPAPAPSQFTDAQRSAPSRHDNRHTETVIQPPTENTQPNLSDLVAQELAKEQAPAPTNHTQNNNPVGEQTPEATPITPTPQPAPPINPSQPQQ